MSVVVASNRCLICGFSAPLSVVVTRTQRLFCDECLSRPPKVTGDEPWLSGRRAMRLERARMLTALTGMDIPPAAVLVRKPLPWYARFWKWVRSWRLY